MKVIDRKAAREIFFSTELRVQSFRPVHSTAAYIESDCDTESLHWPMSSITDEIPAEFKSIIKPFHRICERILRKHGRLRSVAQKWFSHVYAKTKLSGF